MSKDTRYRERDWLYEQYTIDGLTQLEISEICGVCKLTIAQWIKKFSLHKFYHNRDWLYEHYITMGESTAVIAGMCTACDETIRSSLKKFGIKLRPQKTPKEMLKAAKSFAESKRWECASAEYVNNHTPLSWKCEFGHEWQSCYKSVVNRQTGCPHCIGRIVTLNDARELAESKGGECLSKEYTNNSSKLLWKCGECENVWWASYNNVKNNHAWCPACASRNNIHESAFRDEIESITGTKFPPAKPGWLVNPETGYRLEIDGYNKELQLGFEYQGEQHFKFRTGFFHRTKDDFDKQVYRDKTKRRMLTARGIKMLYPTYKLKHCEYNEYIITELGIGRKG